MNNRFWNEVEEILVQDQIAVSRLLAETEVEEERERLSDLDILAEEDRMEKEERLAREVSPEELKKIMKILELSYGK